MFSGANQESLIATYEHAVLRLDKFHDLQISQKHYQVSYKQIKLNDTTYKTMKWEGACYLNLDVKEKRAFSIAAKLNELD